MNRLEINPAGLGSGQVPGVNAEITIGHDEGTSVGRVETYQIWKGFAGSVVQTRLVVIRLLMMGLMFGSGSRLCAEAPSGSGLPPVGKRIYVLDSEKIFDPTAIIPSDREAITGKRRVLKDPINDFGPIEPTASVRKPALAAKRPAKTGGVGRMRLKPVTVSGRLSRPRVNFTRESLPLERADEPVAGTFYEKVFDPATDWDF